MATTNTKYVHTSTDRNAQEPNAIYWFNGGEWGVCIDARYTATVLDSDGAPVEPCNYRALLGSQTAGYELIEAANELHSMWVR